MPTTSLHSFISKKSSLHIEPRGNVIDAIVTNGARVGGLKEQWK